MPTQGREERLVNAAKTLEQVGNVAVAAEGASRQNTKMPKRTAAQEHAMAMVSAFATVQKYGKATVKDVCREQGLVEIRAKKALADLHKAKKVYKVKEVYYLKVDPQKTF